jgi:hypothetical protein
VELLGICHAPQPSWLQLQKPTLAGEELMGAQVPLTVDAANAAHLPAAHLPTVIGR